MASPPQGPAEPTPSVADSAALPDFAGPSRRHRTLMVVIAVAAMIAVGWALAANWAKVTDYSWQLSPGWVAFGALSLLLGYQVNGTTYARSVETLSSEHPPRRIGISIWARALLARYIPGSVMMVVGRVVMSSRWGVSTRTTITATIYETLLGLGIGAAAALAYVVLYGGLDDRRVLLLLAIIPAGVIALHPRIFGPLTAWALRLMRKPPLEQTYGGRQITWLVVGYTAGAVFTCLGVWGLVRAAAGTQVGGPLEISLAFLLAFAVSTVAFIFPSGLGLRDVLLAALFARNLGGGAAGPALALAVGLRFALVVIELTYVALAVAAGRVRR